MFKVENTGMPAWKKIVDEEGNHIADLDELYNGDWSITEKNSLEWITETRFSNGPKAVNWLWKNRYEVGEPFSLYQEKEKKPKKKDESPENDKSEIIDQGNENDLFRSFKI